MFEKRGEKKKKGEMWQDILPQGQTSKLCRAPETYVVYCLHPLPNRILCIIITQMKSG